jgi:hypothetical protein
MIYLKKRIRGSGYWLLFPLSRRRISCSSGQSMQIFEEGRTFSNSKTLYGTFFVFIMLCQIHPTLGDELSSS